MTIKPTDYPLIVEPLSEEEGGGFVAIAPDLSGWSDGETPEEAVANVRDAVLAWIEAAEDLSAMLFRSLHAIWRSQADRRDNRCHRIAVALAALSGQAGRSHHRGWRGRHLVTARDRGPRARKKSLARLRRTLGVPPAARDVAARRLSRRDIR